MTEEISFSSFFLAILAANLILSGENDEAVYMMFYCALMNELVLRDPKRLREILDTSSTLEQVCAHCIGVQFVVSAQSRSEFIEHLIDHLHMTCENLSPRSVELSGLANILRALQEEQMPGREKILLHSLKRSEETIGEIIRIAVTNMDDGSESSAGRTTCYSDATLGWLLKTIPGNYFRVVHNGRSLFLSSCGKNTL